MATCPHTDGVIPLLHDNALQNPLRRATVAHMAICVTCARAFSLLEREQELFTQVVEERVDSIDFSNFWQAVEIRLSDSAPSWAVRLRLWYESWRPAWAFPVPAWAVATLFLFLVPTHLSVNNEDNNPPPNTTVKPDPVAEPPIMRVDTSPKVPQSPPSSAPHTNQLESPPIRQVGLNENQAQIESLYSSGSGAVGIVVQYDPESNSTVILYGSDEYPQ